MSVLRFTNTKTLLSWGRDKRAFIAALRQAKIYPPRQAAAAAIHRQIVDCSFRNPRAAAIHNLVDCSIVSSWIVAAAFLLPNLTAAIHESQYTRTLGISWIAARGLQQPQCTSRNPRDVSFLTRGLRQLVDCGRAAVGVEALQYKPFYTVPFKWWILTVT